MTPDDTITVNGRTMRVTNAATSDGVTTLALAEVPDEPVEEMPEVLPGFESVLVIEGERTTDGREIAENALTWRELPIPLMVSQGDESTHYEVIVIGQIQEVYREGNEIRARGIFDLDSDLGMATARRVRDQFLRWVSIDLEVIDYELEQIDPECIPSDENGFWCEYLERVTEGRIMGATVVATPAFPSAVIVPEGSTIPAATDDGRPAIVAHGDMAPPASWFEDPALTGPTPLTVTEEGRVFGHAAIWGTCHIGREGVCITPPTSASAYAYFRTGAVLTAEGSEVPTGALTVGGGHAGLNDSGSAAAAHYDDAGCAVADVASGEDAHGIWVAGSVRSAATAEQIAMLRASALSGDWRRIAGGLELVAMLAVNVPGFPVPRARVASGVQTSLVAAGARIAPCTCQDSDVTARIEELTARTRKTFSEMVRHLR